MVVAMKKPAIGKFDSFLDSALAQGISREQAIYLAKTPEEDLHWIFAGADYLRRLHFGNKVQLCSIINAKSGICGEDCAFCAQSGHYDSEVNKYPFIDDEKIHKAAISAKDNGASEFSLVTSGKSLEGNDFQRALEEVEKIAGMDGINSCISPGILDELKLTALKNAGLKRFHHNLETSKSYYPKVCTTRTYAENIATISKAMEMGLSVCAGAIFGMGESAEQRVELAFDLKDLGIKSVPINFLHPIPNTPMESKNELTPMDCLRIISLFRYILPDAMLILCGGREHNLKSLQPIVFVAGASGMMVGNYLTTQGASVRDDLRMLQDLGLEPVGKVNES